MPQLVKLIGALVPDGNIQLDGTIVQSPLRSTGDVTIVRSALLNYAGRAAMFVDHSPVVPHPGCILTLSIKIPDHWS